MSGNSTGDLVEVNEDDISYFKEMLGSTLGKFGLGATVLSMLPAAVVGGPALALFPLIAYAGGTTIASLFIPASPVFRSRINRRLRAEKREKLRQRFLEKLAQESGRTESLVELGGMTLIDSAVDLDQLEWHPNVEPYRPEYQRMLQRLQNLKKLAATDDSSISPEEVERLENASVDFLRLVYARLNLLNRLDNSKAEEVELRLSDLDEQIDSASGGLRVRLERAKADLERTAAQMSQLPARDAAVAAQLLHMSETMEELYHRITADPAGVNLSSYLDEATEKLSIEEELQWAADQEIASMNNLRQRAQASRQAQ